MIAEISNIAKYAVQIRMLCLNLKVSEARKGWIQIHALREFHKTTSSGHY